MAEYEIERGVPVPDKGSKSKYPLREMEIGDSFFVPNAKNTDFAVRYRLKPKTFVVRVDLVDGVKGIRVWRTK